MEYRQPKWYELAACLGTDLDFYDLSLDNAKACIEVCQGCPVIDECLEASIHPKWENMGIWGGLRPEPRQSIRRKEARLRLRESRA